MLIDESYKSFKKYDLKICYKLKLDGEKDYSDRRVIANILKLDENNQYGFAMTKPMSVGRMKEKKPDWIKFNLLLETVSLHYKIGHLFVVDIEFDYENADAQHLMYNEIYAPVIEKQKKLDANERLIFQLCELFSETTELNPKSYRTTKKSQATLLSKKFIPLYLEHLKFLISRCFWKVTKLYSNFTFKRSRFKKDFILLNQRSRQTAKNATEKDFYKLLNNANFGYDCRNNLDNCKFEPIYDEIGEISYIRKYYN